MTQIHPTALVDPGALIGSDVAIGPYAVIEADVCIGEGCRIGAHTVIKRHVRIGARNIIAEHVVIGGTPQDLGFKKVESYVHIGDGNILREYFTVHRSKREGQATCIGDRNFLMAYTHVAHDCKIGNDTIFANGASLCGHVTIGDRVFLAGYAGIHQFCRVGDYAMIGGLAKVTQDCLPFMLTDGHPARARGLNVVGLRRAGVSRADLGELKNAFKILFREGKKLSEALSALEGSPCALVLQLAAFIRGSERGFAHHR